MSEATENLKISRHGLAFYLLEQSELIYNAESDDERISYARQMTDYFWSIFAHLEIYGLIIDKDEPKKNKIMKCEYCNVNRSFTLRKVHYDYECTECGTVDRFTDIEK